MTTIPQFIDAVSNLHREKDAAYGNSWKKRGELISIMANIARKVDRLEVVLNGAQTSRDESLIDTVVDLLVYSLKYLTFLADQDPKVDRLLFGANPTLEARPRSDGTDALDWLLRTLDTTPLATPAADLGETTRRTIAAYERLERLVRRKPDPAEFGERAELARALIGATTALLGAVREAEPVDWDSFVETWRARPKVHP
ncbi:hypothetical protein [Plantactinospora sp. KLBMP9567]|uniref:hypothetical protein n=1 Tax=Plantactinospora sp. KLBMP9567 TaxID=3085900 RepID=UPI002981406E|nr:hypothetical protein [Plantactinospora sp. KLBMP9567]MDW5327188.1 hypothetical protein [Plantactinospora sp. KLBMP9567]